MFDELLGKQPGGWRRVSGEADPAGPCGHRKDVILSERNDTGGFSAEGWHGVTYINRGTLMDY